MKNPKVENDDHLVTQLSKGEKVAFNEIFERYWDSLYAKAFQRLQDEASAKDVVQNVFISLWQRRKEVKIVNLRSYLYGAVRFQVYKQISLSRKHDHFFEPFEEMIISPMRSDHNLLRDDLAQLLLAWIETLPRKRRQIFVLFYQEQLSVPEIADRLGISRKTVYNQLSNCVNELQWKLAKYYIILTVISVSIYGNHWILI